MLIETGRKRAMADSNLEIEANVTAGRTTLLDGMYTKLEKLGEGGFGQVNKYRHHDSNVLVAIKTWQIRPKDKVVKSLKELHNFFTIRIHDNIVRWYDSFQIDTNTRALVMELMDFDLDHFLEVQSKPDFSSSVKFDLSLQIATGLNYLHSHKPQLIHRDIKPQNILMKTFDSLPKRHIAKIADFGISSIVLSNNLFENATVEELNSDQEKRSKFKNN